MKLKLVIGAVALLLMLVIGLLVISREPEYGGRTLSSWLEDLDHGRRGFDRAKVPNAEEAVRQIGPRGVPTLINMMRYRETSIGVRLRKLLGKQKIIKVNDPPSAEHVQWRGTRAVWILESKAYAAVPDLVPLLTNQSTWVRGSAAMALGKIGTNAAAAMPALMKSLDDPNVGVRINAATYLPNIGRAAHEAVPVLVRHFTDRDPYARSVVMGTFLAITNDRAFILPYLIVQLSDPHTDMRGRAAAMLGNLGQGAISAVPELRKRLDDPDKNVRRTVTNALDKIAGTETQSTNAQGVNFRFEKASSKNILDFYGSLLGKRIEIAREIRTYTPVSIVSYEAMPLDKALRLLEQELSEQANLLLTPSTNGAILVTYKQREGKAAE